MALFGFVRVRGRCASHVAANGTRERVRPYYMLYCVTVSQTIQRSCSDTSSDATAYLLLPTNCQRAGWSSDGSNGGQRSRVVGVRQVLQRIQCNHVKRDHACARYTR